MWGDNYYGQLGQNNISNYNYPVEVFGDGIDWNIVDAGNSFVGGVHRNYKQYAWGKNAEGQLGSNNTITTSTPIQNISAVSLWCSFSAGGSHSAALENATPSASPTPSFTETPAPTATPLPTVTPSPSVTPSPTSSPNPTSTPFSTPFPTPSFTSSPAPTSSPQPTASPTASPIPTSQPTPSPSASPAPTLTPLPTSQSGYLYAWGPNSVGMLGNNSDVESVSQPVQNIMNSSYWLKISSGYTTAAAIKNDNTLWLWGNNFYYMIGNGADVIETYSSPVQTAIGGNNWLQISVGRWFSAAITNSNVLYMWGYNAEGGCGTNTSEMLISTPTQIVSSNNWLNVSCGGSHVMAVKTNGSLWGWGNNQNGQLGLTNVSGTNYSSPVQTISQGTNWVQVACGLNHSLGLKNDGSMWVWGYNYYGQLGNNQASTTGIYSPVKIGTNSWVQVAAGYNMSAAIRNDGALFTWGFNGYGSLGDSTVISRSSPAQIGANLTWVEISVGASNISARKTDGTIWTAGNGTFGRIGNNTSISQSSFVQTGSSTSAWVAVDMFTTGLGIAKGTPAPSVSPTPQPTPTPTPTALPPIPVPTVTFGNFKLFTWGSNEQGQLGQNTSFANMGISVPTQVGTATNWSLVAGSNVAFLAVKSDGTLWGWGYNNMGQLGIGNLMNKSVPVQIGTGTDWATVQNGVGANSYAIKNNGALYAWGSNFFGQLGTNNTIYYSSPILVTGNSWYAITISGENACGIDTQGRLWTVGWGRYGLLGNNSLINVSSFVQTSIGGYDWSMVEASANVLALKKDGSIWVWGDNYYGNLGIDNRQPKYTPYQVGTETNWADISAGQTYQCGGVKTDGTLWMWGRNYTGAIGDGTTINRSSPVKIGAGTDWLYVFGGYKKTFAMKTNGTLWAWGQNNLGALGNNSIVNTSSPVQVGVVTTYRKMANSAGSSAALRT